MGAWSVAVWIGAGARVLESETGIELKMELQISRAKIVVAISRATEIVVGCKFNRMALARPDPTRPDKATGHIGPHGPHAGGSAPTGPARLVFFFSNFEYFLKIK